MAPWTETQKKRLVSQIRIWGNQWDKIAEVTTPNAENTVKQDQNVLKVLKTQFETLYYQCFRALRSQVLGTPVMHGIAQLMDSEWFRRHFFVATVVFYAFLGNPTLEAFVIFGCIAAYCCSQGKQAKRRPAQTAADSSATHALGGL